MVAHLGTVQGQQVEGAAALQEGEEAGAAEGAAGVELDPLAEHREAGALHGRPAFRGAATGEYQLGTTGAERSGEPGPGEGTRAGEQDPHHAARCQAGSKSGWLRSRSEITSGGKGQGMAKAGSSQRRPRSRAGS